MAIEIERKFLVKERPFAMAKKSLKINQGYILNEKSKVIRVREKGDDYFLTIKGNNIGISRLDCSGMYLLIIRISKSLVMFFIFSISLHEWKIHLLFLFVQ